MTETRASLAARGWFWFLARPTFRAFDWFCSYAACFLEKDSGLAGPSARERLADYDARRMALQHDLAGLSASHSTACAECKGACCAEERFRDAFFDRVLQDPGTANRTPRSLRSVERETEFGPVPLRGLAQRSEFLEGYCPNCTTEGCRVPYELRPIQCTAFVCWQGIALLSQEECETGIRAVAGLMGVMTRTVALAAKSRTA